jgi:hypothetical protein
MRVVAEWKPLLTASNTATINSVDVVDLTDNNTITITATGPGITIQFG